VSLVLVEPEGLTAPERSRPHRSAGRRHWISAAIVGVLAAATLAIGESGGVDVMHLSERRLIEAHLDAWYGGDFEAASEMRAEQKLRTGPTEERARAEVEYQAALGATTELFGCEPLPPSTFRCDVSYSNALNEAVGKEPAVVAQQFGIEEGRILFVAGPYLDDELLTDSYREFADLLFPTEYDASCADEPGYQQPQCALFKLAHLEDWASWHLIEYG
jgi:hypothetical protein